MFSTLCTVQCCTVVQAEIVRAKRDKDLTEQQLKENKRNNQSLAKEIGILASESVKINRNTFLFFCLVSSAE